MSEICFFEMPLWPVFKKCAHGKRESDATVKVASSELEKVRVEQNHCHGLSTVKIKAMFATVALEA
jgi:hypothetical protein